MFSKLSSLIILLCCITYIHTRICKSVDIRNETHIDKLNNCTKIVGHLKITLLQEFSTFPTFPELIEVTEFVMVFLMFFIRDLSEIFPNLIVIRGLNLWRDNALIIFHNPHMQKIGLNNLREIQRGTVEIGKCDNLCYVNTINWTALGTSLTNFSDFPKCDNEECAPDCNGYCWAPGKCQHINENCHPECLGCNKPNSPKECHVCKNWLDVDTCVSECPPDKYLVMEMLTCVSKEECKNMIIPDERWIFNKWCLPKNTCPDNYELTEDGKTCTLCIDSCKKVCDGSETIETRSSLELFKGCTHITGNLEIKLTEKYLMNHLADNLGEIREIEGCIIIGRSDAISSLQFLKNLRKIEAKHEDCNNYAVFIYENSNLKTLINVDKIETPPNIKIRFHDNPELCVSEIEEFAQKLGITHEEFQAILKVGKDISPYSNGDKAACATIKLNITIIHNNSTNITLKWKQHMYDGVPAIGYAFFYILENALDRKSSHDISSDMCNNNSWNSNFISNNSIQLVNLKPFTSYVYWIKVYHMKSDHMAGVAGSTEKKTFKTLPDDPLIPESFETKAISSTSILVTWDPPEETNGDLSHYQLVAFIEKDDPKFVSRRNYCLYPHVVEKEEKKPTNTRKLINQTENGTCVCETRIFKMDDSFCKPSNDELSYSIEDCNKYMYNMIEKPKIRSKKYALRAKSGARKISNETIIDLKLPANKTSYILKNLVPFTNYVILFSACNQEFRGKQQCSAVLFSAVRTEANFSADRVSDVNLKIIQDNNVEVSWKDSPNPNGLIVSYNIQYKNTKSNHKPECITYAQHMKNNFIYRIEELDPGIYTMRIRPSSLAGPGIYSEPITFKIKSPLKPWVIYLLILIVLIIIILLLSKYLWLKRRNHLYDTRLVASINPDYESAMYVLDSWELNRNDIEIHEELGQGVFGLVFSGYIKSKNIPCAVKTVNDHVSLSYKTEFLNEASVMKKFSDAHHVVKLYGVVSIGQPPLVVMELMERGDLKGYLRKSRDSSQSIPTAEIYRMAAEIADGMSYLAAKKYVHRDLAARNCMVAGDRTVKIGDFGMTRDIYETDYYRKGTRGLLPVRWMAPESLADGIFTSESDVWSYGVVLWEMVTLAEQPYQGMSNDQVLNFVISRGRLGRPSECSDILWEIMEVCWKHRPTDRPLFIGIVEKLSPLAGPSFALVSFYHSQEGRDHRLNHKKQIDVTNVLTSGDNVFPQTQHSFSEDEDSLLPQDEDFYPSNTRAFKRGSIGSPSWQSSYTISNQSS